MSRKTPAGKTSRAKRASAEGAKDTGGAMPASLRVTSEDEYRSATSGLLTLQSGRVFHVRRPSEIMMVKHDRLPRSFVQALQAADGETDKEKIGQKQLTDMSEQDMEKVIIFARELVCNISVRPRVEMDGKDGALKPNELDAKDFWELFLWATNGGPTLPIITEEGGALTTGELESFRTDGQLSTDEPHVSELRYETQPSPRVV